MGVRQQLDPSTPRLLLSSAPQMKALDKMVLLLCVLSASCSQYQELWTQSELEYCGWRIRTPALMRSKNAIHVLGRCCGPNLCSSKPDACVGQPPNQHCKNATNGTSPGMLGDDNSDSRTVMKSSELLEKVVRSSKMIYGASHSYLAVFVSVRQVIKNSRVEFRLV